jgi:hypothetical protein
MSGLREERRRRSARFQLEQAASRRDPLPFSVRRIVKPAKQRPIDAAEELALRLVLMCWLLFERSQVRVFDRDQGILEARSTLASAFLP